jgi:diaminopimelate decarboxylase
LAVLRALVAHGAGLDIVSGGELFRALKVGAEPKKIVYAGVGKTEDEIEFALKKDILLFNVESEAELSAINHTASRLGKIARVSIRLNPEID